jgi:hypothetical protein
MGSHVLYRGTDRLDRDVGRSGIEQGLCGCHLTVILHPCAVPGLRGAAGRYLAPLLLQAELSDCGLMIIGSAVWLDAD